MSLFEQVLFSGEKSESGWVKWYHKQIPDEEGESRDQARDIAKLAGHCKKCTALSGCYFPSNNMPQYP